MNVEDDNSCQLGVTCVVFSARLSSDHVHENLGTFHPLSVMTF